MKELLFKICVVVWLTIITALTYISHKILSDEMDDLFDILVFLTEDHDAKKTTNNLGIRLL